MTKRYGIALIAASLAAAAASGLRAEEPRMRDFSVSAAIGHFSLGGSPETSVEKKRLGRAVLECAGLMAISQTSYWLRYDHWSEDWRYQATWKDQTRRLFWDAWRFDSNTFRTNWTHAPAGAIYYNFARANNLSVLESALFATATSSYWELLVEWREVISINDSILTGPGGAAIGEVWYQLGRYFDGRDGWLDRALSFFNPVLKLNRWLDRKIRLGLPADPVPGWSEASWQTGWRRTDGPSRAGGGQARAGGRVEIIHDPDYGRPGERSGWEWTTAFTGLMFDAGAGRKGFEEADLSTRTVWGGYLRRSIDDQGRGSEIHFGATSGFSCFWKGPVADYDSSRVKVTEIDRLRLDEPRDFRDKLAAFHVIGPAVDATMFRGRFRLRFQGEATLDFAQVNAYALNAYSIDHPIRDTKSTLRTYGYYYGWGASLAAGLRAEWGGLRFEAGSTLRLYRSIDGMDNFQAEMTDDFPLWDRYRKGRLGLEFRIPGSPLALTASYERAGRWGRIRETVSRGVENRFSAGLRLVY